MEQTNQKLLLQLLQNRILFAYRFFENREGKRWRVREYQKESLLSNAVRKVHCDGRDVGKTSEIEIIACWAMLNCPGKSMLIATQCENHLFPVMNRIFRKFEITPEFSSSIVELRRSPSYFIRFTNGFTLWGRIAGPRGINFQGMHVDWQIVDEAQEMTDTSWGELYQALNSGGKRWVYGVPNGIRNTFYRMTFLREAEQYRWQSYLNPEYTREKDEELAQLYGGRDSPGYKHRVLGIHGEPENAVFNLDDYYDCIDDSLRNNELLISKGALGEISLPPAEQGNYYLGCDLGYSRDPSEFVVFKNDFPHLINVFRVHLENVNYTEQEKLICQLDRVFNFRKIGIDSGGSGQAVAHHLVNQSDELKNKICLIEFGGTVETFKTYEGKPSRRRVKEWMTELLQRMMSDRNIIFPRCIDRENQYANHTYYVNSQGACIYSKGNDHIIDADRCAVYTYWLDTKDETSFRRRITKPIFKAF
ncbi:MAG: hypothetical protein N3G21_13220 [Candidatus Hydrogenedentes bacterium]|nr:hypothetical protein [Candidatus Hydrogenedentota bacterium]